MLVVLDMDRTMVGDLTSLSDRDNLETNIEWTWWPENKVRGLDAAFIQPYLERGMLRPGMVEFLAMLRDIGATTIVYTHSEYVWARKVCDAMEAVVGFPFIKHLFGRSGSCSVACRWGRGGITCFALLVVTIEAVCA